MWKKVNGLVLGAITVAIIWWANMSVGQSPSNVKYIVYSEYSISWDSVTELDVLENERVINVDVVFVPNGGRWIIYLVEQEIDN